MFDKFQTQNKMASALASLTANYTDSEGEEDLSSNIPLVSQTEEQEEDVLYQTGSAATSPVSGPPSEMEINIKPGDIVKTREFWILWVTFLLNTQVTCLA